MVGGLANQFHNLLTSLKWVCESNPSPAEVHDWLKHTFDLSEYFAKDIYSVLFISSGLIKVKEGRCALTTEGHVVLQTSSPSVMLEIFEKSFVGIAAILEILRDQAHLHITDVKRSWKAIVERRYPKIKQWSDKTLHTQCKHRIDWLRTLGFISFHDSVCVLSSEGIDVVKKYPPEAYGIQAEEIKRDEKVLEAMANKRFNPFDAQSKFQTSIRESLVRDRAFRKLVIQQYRQRCAVCGFGLTTPNGGHGIQAAHIIPKAKYGTDDPRNGIGMCGVCHWAFDEGVFSISPTSKIITASYLRTLKKDHGASTLLSCGGKPIQAVKDRAYQPASDALDWHRKHVFLG